MLRKDKDGLIRYNYSKIIVTREGRTYKTLKGKWLKRIQKV